MARPPDRPLVVLRGHDQDPVEVAWQAAEIGLARRALGVDRQAGLLLP